MKKLLCLLFALLLCVFAFAACGDEGKKPEKKPEETVSSEESESSSEVSSTGGLTFAELRDQAEKPVLTEQQAQETALEKSGKKENQVHNLETKLAFSSEYFVWTYTVSYDHENYSYKIDIDAVNGEIINFFSKIN